MTDFREAEENVAKYLRQHGFENVEVTSPGFPSVDITAEKEGKRFAFQVKNRASTAPNGVLEKFNSEFVDTKESKVYKNVFYISKMGFAKKVYPNIDIGLFHKKLKIGFWIESATGEILYIAGIDEKLDKKLYENIFQTDDEGTEFEGLNWDFQKEILKGLPQIDPPLSLPVRIAICTLKGGVGKTTVSANLAGSFAKKNLDVSLVDCDPRQYSLLRLFSPGALCDDVDEIKIGNNSIACHRSEYWETTVIPQAKASSKNCGDIVIYDCPPKLDEKNTWWKWIFENTDLCLVPVNICPIGLGKAGLDQDKSSIEDFSVISQTIEAIQKVNPEIHILIVENNKMKTKENKNVLSLRGILNKALKKKEGNISLIDPFIRHSEKIYYWGFEKHKLPIDNNSGGQSIPSQDFEILAEYILKYSRILFKKNIKRQQSPNLQNAFSKLEKVNSLKEKLVTTS
jgi:cellulose biosynthesis protein BcsQ